jgi:hypothetical protein
MPGPGGASGASFKKNRRHKLAPMREFGTFALHCVGANFSVGAKICLKNWPQVPLLQKHLLKTITDKFSSAITDE